MSQLPAQGVREASEDFTWGEVITAFSYDLDGDTCTVIKYHPWVSEKGNIRVGHPDKEKVLYHNAETRWSDTSVQACVIRWVAHLNLGLNQHALVAGVCRALNVSGEANG